MHDVPLLRELLVVVTVSLVVVHLVRRVRIPAVIGFLLSGMLLGPGGLGLVSDQHSVEVLADFGVALLLFTIGLKFSLREMQRLKYWVFGAGGLQVALTIGIAYLVARVLGFGSNVSLLVGFLIALSSTAIVLKLQEERGESSSVAGRLSLSILIFQDIAVVPLLLVVPLLGGQAASWVAAALGLLKSLALVVVLLLAARLVIPRLLEYVVGVRSPEIFTLTIGVIAMGTAYISSQAGLSLALGAFLAGVVISETLYSHHVTAQIMPVRDALSSLFFVSVGMLVHPATWPPAAGTLVGLTVGVIALKAGVVIIIALLFGVGLRNALLTGLALAQIGEFAFLLLRAASTTALLDESSSQLFLSASVLSMALTPLLMAGAPRLAARLLPLGNWLTRRRLASAGVTAVATDEPSAVAVSDHVIIIGYGVNGRNVARALTGLDVQVVVVELNQQTVREMDEEGMLVMYGDACQEVLLRRAGAEAARVLVIAIADPVAVRCITAVAHHLNPDLHIVVRTRFVSEVEALRRLGAAAVVPEEFETSLELVALTMRSYGATQRDIEEQRARIRDQSYALLREQHTHTADHPSLRVLLEAVDVVEVKLRSGAPAVGKTLRDLDLRNHTGATMVGLKRGGISSGSPLPDVSLLEGDVLLILGDRAALQKAGVLLNG